MATFDFVLGEPPHGHDPERIRPFRSGLTFTDAYRNTAEALAFIERVTGVRLTRDWLRQPRCATRSRPPCGRADYAVRLLRTGAAGCRSGG
jgi:hypothetical protein